MLGPVDRLKAGAQAKAHRWFTNLLIGIVIFEILTIMYAYPSIALLLAICGFIAGAGIFVLVIAFAVVNEIIWLLYHKRF